MGDLRFCVVTPLPTGTTLIPGWGKWEVESGERNDVG